jgi:hypothetical protein
MITAWIAGDCWLKPGGAALDLKSLWGEARPEILALNLECAVQAGTARAGRGALLPLDPRRLPEIAIAENNVALMANNHVSDFGPEGLLATLQALRRAGFRSVGAGSSLAEARTPEIIQVAGRRIGMLAYADTAPHVGSVAATDTAPGVAPLIPEMIIADVRQTTAQVDDVWLFLHWGIEYVRYPEPKQRQLARAFAEAGAHLIVGIHPHVVSGNETIADTPVYYSMGNFAFPPILLSDGSILPWGRASRHGLMLKGTLGIDAWNWTSFPVLISDDGTPSAPQPDEEQIVRRDFSELSLTLNDEYLQNYPSLRRGDLFRHRLWRLWMMTWPERIRLLRRRISGRR